MKTAFRWLVACLFAFQAAGGMWHAHLSRWDEPSGQDVALRHVPACGSDVRAAAGIERETGRPSGPGKPSRHRHDSQTCGICQVLLSLSATASVPPALPTIAQAVSREPIPADQFFIDVFLAAFDARGPPAFTLLYVPVS